MKNSDAGITISRRHLLLGILLSCAVLLLLLCSIGVYGSIRSPEHREETISRQPPAASAAAPAALYILREYEQRIGIFEEGERTPIQVLDVYVFTLPESDQAELKSGIRIYSDDALLARIEDFTG